MKETQKRDTEKIDTKERDRVCKRHRTNETQC